MPDSREHAYGRRGFLLLVAGGISSLAWAGPASRVLSPLTSAVSQLAGDLLPIGGWRIYTISGTMPNNGLVAEPGLRSVAPGKGEIKIPPVSVCHHVSMIGQRSRPMCS